MPRYYGIDLGTSNTVVSACTTSLTSGAPKLETLRIRQKDYFYGRTGSEELLPSIIYIDDNGEVQVGKEAKGFKENGGDHRRFIYNTKLRMGQEAKIAMGGKNYTPVDVAKLVLEKCRQEIVYHSKGTFTDNRIVITVPASFGKEEREATQNAAYAAGFEDVTIFDEPSAALISFVYENASDDSDVREINFSAGKNVLTIDLGGGTCDICYFNVKQNEMAFELTDLRPCQRINLGGSNFDKAVAEYIIENTLRRRKKIMYEDITPDDLNALLVFAERAKEEISARIDERIAENYESVVNYETSAKSDVIFQDEYYEMGVRFMGSEETLKITKKQIDDAIDKLIVSSGAVARDREKSENLVNIEDCIRRIVNLEKDNIDYVLFTGGMSKYLTLRKKLFQMIGCPIISPKDAMTAVARGAALYNIYKVEKSAVGFDFDRTNITTEAIMLDMKEGLPMVLVPKGTPIKDGFHRVAEGNEIRTSSPTGVKIGFFEGDDEFDCNLKKLQNVVINFPKIKQPGMPFKIHFSIDENRMYEFKIEFEDGDGYRIDTDGNAVPYQVAQEEVK